MLVFFILEDRFQLTDLHYLCCFFSSKMELLTALIWPTLSLSVISYKNNLENFLTTHFVLILRVALIVIS